MEQVFNKIEKCVKSAETIEHIKSIYNMVELAKVLYPNFSATYYYKIFFLIRDVARDKNIVLESELYY